MLTIINPTIELQPRQPHLSRINFLAPHIDLVAILFALLKGSVIFCYGRFPPFAELDVLLLKILIRNCSRFGTKKSKLHFRFPCLNGGCGLSCEIFLQLGFKVAKKIGWFVRAIFEICADHETFLILFFYFFFDLVFDLDLDLVFVLVFDDGVLGINIF